MTASVDNNALSDPSLLEKVDLNIGQHVPLPQVRPDQDAVELHEELQLILLVEAGDKSSGKFSLLESLTDVPFPKDHTLCTR